MALWECRRGVLGWRHGLRRILALSGLAIPLFGKLMAGVSPRLEGSGGRGVVMVMVMVRTA